MTRYLAVKKVSKKMYAGTHNFKDEADGTSGTDIDFVDTATLYNGALEIIASWQGHRKVLKLTDDITAGEDPQFIHNITQATSGTHEFYLGTNDVTEYWDIMFLESGIDNIVRFRIITSSLDYLDNVDAWQAIQAVANDTLYHLKIVWRADNTFDVYVDGILKVDNVATNNNQVSGINALYIRATGDSTDCLYLDAYGEAEDTDYNIGDNIHYRHFKESTDSLELDDVGTQGTSITWVDAVDTAASVEIVQEFNAHKKILRQYYSSGAGGFDYSWHYFASQAKDGWFSFGIKVTSITAEMEIDLFEGGTLVTSFMITASQFQKYTATAWSQISGSPTPVVDTWYFVYLEWVDAATDTITCVINNIEYETFNAEVNQPVSGIDRVRIISNSATEYMYIDAPMSSLDSDVRADNRTFDYHDPYTKTDITSDVIDIINYENKIYEWRKATLVSKEEYEFTNEFFQIYDVNSVLAIEGEIKNRIQNGILRRYPLRDKNYDDLMERITNTFATDAIHDPTDSTSLLKVALPNVDQTEGDLLLADADTEAATYSPTLKNHPTYMFLRDISDLGDTVTIVKANGVVLLDDDLASGDTLDIDTAAHKAKFTKAPPLVTDILEVINYFEIFGAINPDTGERFYKVIDNSGDDKKRKWRYVNNKFHTQADVDAYAAALNTRITTVKIITFTVQDLGVHNMGTTLNFKFVQGDYNIPQANYYIISENIPSMNANTATIVLSEGLIEESKYSATFERPEDYVNTFASDIYETDLINVFPEMFEGTGATRGIFGIELNADGDFLTVFFHIDEKIDTTRPITIEWIWKRIDANNDTVDYELTISAYEMGGAGTESIEVLTAIVLPACAINQYNKYTYTLASADIYDDYQYYVNLMQNEAGDTLRFTNIKVRYYQKRTTE